VPADEDRLAREAAALNQAFTARGPELREAVVRLFRALDPVIEAYRRTAEQLVNSDGFKQLVAFANSPQGQALIAAAEAGELRRPEPCWCLCQAIHGDDMGICDGEAVGTVVRVSPSLGRVPVQVCGPCRQEQLCPRSAQISGAWRNAEPFRDAHLERIGGHMDGQIVRHPQHAAVREGEDGGRVEKGW
jgi:hypothetical protein